VLSSGSDRIDAGWYAQGLQQFFDFRVQGKMVGVGAGEVGYDALPTGDIVSAILT
jgi:hypothetical protein